MPQSSSVVSVPSSSITPWSTYSSLLLSYDSSLTLQPCPTTVSYESTLLDMLACLNHSNALSSNLNVVLLSHACLDCSTCTCWCLFVGLSSTSLIVLPQLQHRLGSIGGIGIQLGSALLNLNIIVVISLFPVLHLSSLLADLSSLMVAVSLSRLRSTSIILSSVHCSVLIVVTSSLLHRHITAT